MSFQTSFYFREQKFIEPCDKPFDVLCCLIFGSNLKFLKQRKFLRINKVKFHALYHKDINYDKSSQKKD